MFKALQERKSLVKGNFSIAYLKLNLDAFRNTYEVCHQFLGSTLLRTSTFEMFLTIFVQINNW